MAEYITNSEMETQALAAGLARKAHKGMAFALIGDLGAGKSAFARGFIQALMGTIDVPSPTFTLVQQYDTPKGTLYHFDLYRLEDPDEVIEIGWEDAIADGICLIEWPERAAGYMPSGTIAINFMTLGPESRKIVIHDTNP